MRIVAIPQAAHVRQEAEQQKIPVRPQKSILQFVRRGTAVPHIELFKDLKMKLPITRIVVGPHREKENRRRAGR